MKIILTQEVSGLGTPGDIVEVKDGYGRNYLLPQGFAIAWTKGGEKQVTSIKRARSAREIRDLGHANEVKAQLEALKVSLSARAGTGGRLFGSVTPDRGAAGRQGRRRPRPGPAPDRAARPHQVHRAVPGVGAPAHGRDGPVRPDRGGRQVIHHRTSRSAEGASRSRRPFRRPIAARGERGRGERSLDREGVGDRRDSATDDRGGEAQCERPPPDHRPAEKARYCDGERQRGEQPGHALRQLLSSRVRATDRHPADVDRRRQRVPGCGQPEERAISRLLAEDLSQARPAKLVVVGAAPPTHPGVCPGDPFGAGGLSRTRVPMVCPVDAGQQARSRVRARRAVLVRAPLASAGRRVGRPGSSAARSFSWSRDSTWRSVAGGQIVRYRPNRQISRTALFPA